VVEASAPYCGAKDADGRGGWAARAGLKASEAPRTATRTKTAFSLWLPKFVVLFPAREWLKVGAEVLRNRDCLMCILAPVRNFFVVCFVGVMSNSVCEAEPVRNGARDRVPGPAIRGPLSEAGT
jgi:hypothetical protein